MNLGGLLMLRYIGSLPQSAEAQAVYAVGYTELFSLVTWTSVGLMGAAAAVAGQNMGAGHPERSARGVRVAAMIGVAAAGTIGVLFLAVPDALFAVFGMTEPHVLALGRQLLAYLAVSGLFVTVASPTPAGCRGRETRKGSSTSRWPRRWWCPSVFARPCKRREGCRRPTSGWRSCSVTSCGAP